MKWFKQNWMVMLFVIMILIALPLGWFFSNSMNKKLKEDQQTAASNAHQQLQRASVTYQLPSVTPGEPGLELNTVPNDRITEFFVNEKDRIENELEQVKATASQFNRRQHGVLVDGMFPEPSSRRQGQLLAVEMVKLLVGDGGAPSAYERLLDSVNAGTPLDTQMLSQTLNDLDQRERQRIAAETGAATLTPEEAEQIEATLIDRRLREYRRRARELSFYADTNVFFQGEQGAMPPIAVPAQPPEIEECFVWQFDYWVYADILDAINTANTDESGSTVGIERAPVKRVLAIDLEPLVDGSGLGSANTPRPAGSGRDRNPYGEPDPYGGGGDDDFGSGAAGATPGGEVPRDYNVSITGRVSGPENQTYDVRNVELTAIVASKKLPRLIDALAQTNFMTVTGLTIQEVDAWGDLQEGYYYGPDHVVRVTLQIETIWLREWTVPLMPDPIVSALGVVKPQPDEPTDGDG